MQLSTRTQTHLAPTPAAEFLTDPQAAALLALSESRFAEVQRDPGFPRPVWLGPRGKRHVRSELLSWALAQRGARK